MKHFSGPHDGVLAELRHAVRTRRRNEQAVRSIVLGDREPHPELSVRSAELPAAVRDYLRFGRAFTSGGLPRVLAALPGPNVRKRARGGSGPATVFWARDAAWRAQGLARSLAGRHLCLHEAIGVCAALRGLGFAVDIVIGYPTVESEHTEGELHAWPAIGDEPVIERSSGFEASHVELIRYPEPAGVVTSAGAVTSADAGAVCP